ncbi:unnamed protein product [Adineta ricciae]|uniref:Uncharacterized protein n=1 Tax=Adineta ricciae TaxID=249248 RepID=A0A815QPL3_ADIRI|nr:unnamed protein product [Adineta ricciae]CAF1466351.1 unnamed protein product [Adineta ricciae]
MTMCCFKHLWSLISFATIIVVEQCRSLALCPTATWQRNAKTVAGSIVAISGSSSSALNNPCAVNVDNRSNMYVLDSGNYRVQRFLLNSTIGTTIINSSFGTALDQFNTLDDMRIDNNGSIYILDGGNGRVTKWTQGASAGVVVAGGNGVGSDVNQLIQAGGMFLDTITSAIWIADTGNHRIVKWTSSISSIVVCGSIGDEDTQFYYPYGLFVVTSDSDTLYVADTYNHRIQRWVAGATRGTTVAGITSYYGNSFNQLWYPTSIIVDNNQNMFITDSENNRVLRWSAEASSGMIVAGDSNHGTALNLLNKPLSINFDSTGSLFVADSGNNRVQQFVVSCPPPINISTTVSPTAISVTPTNISSSMSPWSLNGTTVAGSPIGWGGSSSLYLNRPSDIAIDKNGTIYVLDSNNYRVQRFLSDSAIGTTVISSSYGAGVHQFVGMDGISIDSNGAIYIVDHGNNRVTKWPPGATNGTVVAGGYGSGSNVNQLSYPYAVFVSYNSSSIWIADTGNHRIVRWDFAITGSVICGGYGSGANQLLYPYGVFVDARASNTLYIADTHNHRIQKWLPSATSGITVAGQTSICGNGYNQLCYPVSVVGDSNGYIYITDSFNSRIMRWMLGSSYGTVATGSSTVGVLPNQLNYPNYVGLDATGALIVVDTYNNRIQKFSVVCAPCMNAETSTSAASSTTG